MRLQPEGMPDPADRYPAESGRLGSAARALNGARRAAYFPKSEIANHAGRATQLSRHRLVIESLRAGQYHARPPSQPGLTAFPMGQRNLAEKATITTKVLKYCY